MDPSLAPEQRASMLLAAMTIDEKIALLSDQMSPYGFASAIPGNDRLCIPELVFSDGPAGVAGGFGGTQTQVTAFPAPMSQASSWDPELQERLGFAMGQEVFMKGANVFLAPALNMARVPMNGRNYEYFGEDPYLAGKTAAAVVRGVQQNPVVATMKHYAVNNQETDRQSVSAEVDERALREIYLPGFEAAVKEADVGAAMCAYNRVNGTYACENPALLTDILKQDWGFDGWVMSDWGATHSTVESALAGLDQEQGSYQNTYYTDSLKEAVEAGQVPVSRLDDMVLRILKITFREGLFDDRPPAQPGAFASDVSTVDHRRLALEVAEAGTVLLKNEGGILPLDRIGLGQTIAVIGRPAAPAGAQAVHSGPGSAHVHAVAVDPLQAIRARAAAQGAAVIHADGAVLEDAVAAATAADIALVFARDLEGEGADRTGLSLNDGVCVNFACQEVETYDQDQLISAVAQANPNTVVVLVTGGPVLMPWLDEVKGLVEAWYPGMEYGDAVASVLFGDVNPSGKLPQTFPAQEADLPTQSAQQYPGENGTAVYSEGLLVGYRWYDAQEIAPLFPFGHGLSYTTFEYRGLDISKKGGEVLVSFVIENTGTRPGTEVAQVYVASPASVGEPPKQLKGYRKVWLSPGESRRVTIPLDRRAFAYWNTAENVWHVARGTYRILVGSSSRDIRLQAAISRPSSTLSP